jgi:cation diffusion facilitator CzcD-associated flavoprotein CzcO
MELADLPFNEEEKKDWVWKGLLADAKGYNRYLNRYAETFLPVLIRFNTRVTNVRREVDKPGWTLTMCSNDSSFEEHFDKVALCTGVRPYRTYAFC